MQTPTIIFDHVNEAVTIVNGGPAADHKLAELAAVQQSQVATSGSTPPKE
jgi:translation initiation factor 1 (eIF-1/SUI1)